MDIEHYFNMTQYSDDLRERIILFFENHPDYTQQEIADEFAASRSFVEKLLQRWRATGSAAALPHGGGQQRLLAAHEQKLRELVAAQPDATLAELREKIESATNLSVSVATMCRALQRLDLGRKKSHQPAEQQRPEVKKEREEFRVRAADWLAGKLKFLDETGTLLNLTRRYGRAVPGQRVVEYIPSDYGSNYTLIGVLGLHGLQAPWVLEGALNGDIFKLYLEPVLGPTLRPGDILIMDNLSSHKVEGVDDLVTARGARLEYLSPYSPDYNPIERCWSKIKTYLRRAKARSYDALVQAIKEALATITASDAREWFKFCGYSIH